LLCIEPLKISKERLVRKIGEISDYELSKLKESLGDILRY